MKPSHRPWPKTPTILLSRVLYDERCTGERRLEVIAQKCDENSLGNTDSWPSKDTRGNVKCSALVSVGTIRLKKKNKKCFSADRYNIIARCWARGIHRPAAFFFIYLFRHPRCWATGDRNIRLTWTTARPGPWSKWSWASGTWSRTCWPIDRPSRRPPRSFDIWARPPARTCPAGRRSRRFSCTALENNTFRRYNIFKKKTTPRCRSPQGHSANAFRSG